jgi:hypothetical protein
LRVCANRRVGVDAQKYFVAKRLMVCYEIQEINEKLVARQIIAHATGAHESMLLSSGSGEALLDRLDAGAVGCYEQEMFLALESEPLVAPAAHVVSTNGDDTASIGTLERLKGTAGKIIRLEGDTRIDRAGSED